MERLWFLKYILVLNNQVWLFWYQVVKGKATGEMTHVFVSKAHEESQNRCRLELNPIRKFEIKINKFQSFPIFVPLLKMTARE